MFGSRSDGGRSKVEARYKIMWQYQCSFVAVISVVLAVRGFVLMQR